MLAAVGTLNLEFPNGAGGLFDHGTGQAAEDGTSPAIAADVNGGTGHRHVVSLSQVICCGGGGGGVGGG